MKKYIFILSFGLLFNFAMAQQMDVEQLSRKFDALLAEQFKAEEPGATVLVAQNGQSIYKKAFGMANLEHHVPMQPNHVFRIGSITKQFTAVAILQLMEAGKLNLQDEITKFLPDYPTHGHKITIEHLLTHTSGIQSYTGMDDYMARMTLDLKPEEMVEHFKHQPMKFAPGTNWDYSNSGYFLLGYIIEKITGKTYGEYLEEHFFQPLGMTHSSYGSDQKIIPNRAGTYSKNDNGFENAQPLSMTQPYSAGSIMSTVEDLFKWNQAVHAFKLVKQETIAKAFTKYKLSDGKETDYGYGWKLAYIQESPTIEHGGGINGTLTMAVYLPKEAIFVAIFSNCDCNSPEDIAVRLAAATLGKPYEHAEIPVEITALQAYTGVYENAKGELRIITVSENQLISQRGRNPQFKLKAYQKDKFFFESGALLTLEFSHNKKKEVDKIITQGRNGTEVWNKTDKPLTILAPVEIKVDEKVLETYVGEYEIEPGFTFVITREQDHLFLQATGQEKVEMFAEAESKFFLKVNDAQLEFMKDEAGKVTKAILKQSGNTTEAKRIK